MPSPSPSPSQHDLTIATGEPNHSSIANDGYGRMVIYMQECQLTEAVFKNHKHLVTDIDSDGNGDEIFHGAGSRRIAIEGKGWGWRW